MRFAFLFATHPEGLDEDLSETHFTNQISMKHFSICQISLKLCWYSISNFKHINKICYIYGGIVPSIGNSVYMYEQCGHRNQQCMVSASFMIPLKFLQPNIYMINTKTKLLRSWLMLYSTPRLQSFVDEPFCNRSLHSSWAFRYNICVCGWVFLSSCMLYVWMLKIVYAFLVFDLFNQFYSNFDPGVSSHVNIGDSFSV